MEKYQNKYRIPSARLQNWNYSWDAAYFITICTQTRIHYLGNITDGEMQLSHIGVIADVLWYEIKNHAQNIELDAFQVMPNHIHGILILNGNDGINDTNDTNGTDGTNVETGHALSLQSTSPSTSSSPSQPPKTIGQQRFQNIGKNSISSIIGSYKSAVTKHSHRLGLEFSWQPSFHDHIIRDNEEYQRIQQYIINNPAKWVDDKFYT
ncbi:MAG: hypothetical protein PHV20_00240 [Bacteroidales bacterium]|nr:hypothetical protein [Bacteroidales bacterium]